MPRIPDDELDRLKRDISLVVLIEAAAIDNWTRTSSGCALTGSHRERRPICAPWPSWAPTRTARDIADKLSIRITTLGSVRASLIKKGMVYSPSHGEMVFTVPLFDEFMWRAMPHFEP